MSNRRGAETQSENQLTEKIIGCAIEVHRTLGPGLLESAYEECLCYEFAQNGFSFSRQVPLPVVKDGIKRIVNQFQETPRLSVSAVNRS